MATMATTGSGHEAGARNNIGSPPLVALSLGALRRTNRASTQVTGRVKTRDGRAAPLARRRRDRNRRYIGVGRASRRARPSWTAGPAKALRVTAALQRVSPGDPALPGPAGAVSAG